MTTTPLGTEPREAEQPRQPRAEGPPWMAKAVLVPLGVLGLALGIVGAFLVPLRVGTVMLPVSPVLAVVGNIAVGVLGARAAGSRAGAVVPGAAWLIAVLALGSARPEGDVILPGGGGEGAVALAFIGLGAVAAAVGVGLGAPRRTTPAGPSRR